MWLTICMQKFSHCTFNFMLSFEAGQPLSTNPAQFTQIDHCQHIFQVIRITGKGFVTLLQQRNFKQLFEHIRKHVGAELGTTFTTIVSSHITIFKRGGSHTNLAQTLFVRSGIGRSSAGFFLVTRVSTASTNILDAFAIYPASRWSKTSVPWFRCQFSIQSRRQVL